MSVSSTTKICLAHKNGNRCAFKGCGVSLTSEGKEPKILGEVAHIHGEKPGSARYKADMSDEERNHYNNLIYLCPNCHKKIDKQENDCPAEYLLSMKSKHEHQATAGLDQGMTEFSFTELETAANALTTGKHFSSDTNFQVIPPAEKIKKNGLSDSALSCISMGLSRSTEVERFLTSMATNVDEKYSERLKHGFKTKYRELKERLSGDELFFSMLGFAQAGQKDFKQEAASLAILSHLFHLCEVFEK